MKARDAIEIIEKDGSFLVRQKGSHKQYKHHFKRDWLQSQLTNKVMIIAPGTLNSIFKQAQIHEQ